MSKRILVVDDSAAMRSMIISSIEDLPDLSITEATNGFEALKILPRNKFDLVITDINMPTINGLEIVHFIKHSAPYKDIPVIIITTEQAQKDRDKGLALGAREYVTKPFDPEKLKTIVTNLLNEQL